MKATLVQLLATKAPFIANPGMPCQPEKGQNKPLKGVISSERANSARPDEPATVTQPISVRPAVPAPGRSPRADEAGTELGGPEAPSLEG